MSLPAARGPSSFPTRESTCCHSFHEFKLSNVDLAGGEPGSCGRRRYRDSFRKGPQRALRQQMSPKLDEGSGCTPPALLALAGSPVACRESPGNGSGSSVLWTAPCTARLLQDPCHLTHGVTLPDAACLLCLRLHLTSSATLYLLHLLSLLPILDVSAYFGLSCYGKALTSQQISFQLP